MYYSSSTNVDDTLYCINPSQLLYDKCSNRRKGHMLQNTFPTNTFENSTWRNALSSKKN